MKDLIQGLWDLKAPIVAVTIIFGIITAIAVAETHEDQRLLSQCMADGKKEYECHAMLDKHEQVVPVFIPGGR